MKSCVRCGKGEREIRLFDAIRLDGVVSICADCSAFETLPVIIKPTTVQLKEADKTSSVYERLTKAAGLPTNRFRSEQDRAVSSALDKIRKPNPVMQQTGLRPVLDRRPLNLIENFHWHIKQNRLRKGYSITQFADLIGEDANIVKMIEDGKLPSDGARLISKIEPVLHIRLRQETTPLDRKSPARAEAGSKQMAGINLSKLQDMQKQKQANAAAKREDDSMTGDDIDVLGDI